MDKKNEIVALFNGLTASEQVEILSTLYFSMYDRQKDEFLAEIEDN